MKNGLTVSQWIIGGMIKKCFLQLEQLAKPIMQRTSGSIKCEKSLTKLAKGVQ